MEGDINLIQDVRMTAARDALHLLGHVSSSGFGCLMWLWSPSDSSIIMRLVLDISRLEYDDPGGANSAIVNAVSASIGFSLALPWQDGEYFEGYVRIEERHKSTKRSKTGSIHILGITGSLLFDLRVDERQVIRNAIISQIVIEYQSSTCGLVDEAGPTAAPDILEQTSFAQNTWLKSYLNPEEFVVVERVGRSFWPKV
jgi:hypothetical protein